MSDQGDGSSLSQIPTEWTGFHQAQAPLEREASPAEVAARRREQERFQERYGEIVRRYLLGTLRDHDAANDLCQEFYFKFVRGSFRNANREKGRLRDYLRRVLIRLISDHKKTKRRWDTIGDRVRELGTGDHGNVGMDDEIRRLSRDVLIEHAWRRLETYPGRAPYYLVLKRTSEDPDADPFELRRRLAGETGRVVTPSRFRTTLHRARRLFAKFLYEELEALLSDTSPGVVRDNLDDLGLLALCRPHTDRRSGPGRPGGGRTRIETL